MLEPIFEKQGGWNINRPIVIGYRDSEKEENQMKRIHLVATEVVETSGKIANTDAVVASIVWKLTEEGVSRKLIDSYFKSEKSILRGKYPFGNTRNGW